MIRDETKTDIKKAAAATKTAAHSIVQDSQDAAQGVADRIRGDAKAAGNAAMDKVSDIAADVSDRVKDAASAAGDMASKTVSDAKDTIADEGHRFAQTLRSAASDRSETMQGRVLDVMAGGVEQVADSVRGRSLNALFADVQTFARRNPGAFVAGAAVVGFALARFVRSGSRSTSADPKAWENRS